MHCHVNGGKLHDDPAGRGQAREQAQGQGGAADQDFAPGDGDLDGKVPGVGLFDDPGAAVALLGRDLLHSVVDEDDGENQAQRQRTKGALTERIELVEHGNLR